MTKLCGVDISAWQGTNVDFTKLKDSVDFVIIRTVSGRTYDKLAKTYINGCYKNGIPYGLYCAAYPLTENDAIAEADKMIKYASMCKPLFPLYYDYEGFSLEYAKKHGYNHSADDIKRLTKIFCDRIESANMFAGVYANLSYSRNIYGLDFFKRYSHWLAYWSSTRALDAPVWQFTSNGSVSGIPGRVDKNICYKDFPSIIKENHLNGW